MEEMLGMVGNELRRSGYAGLLGAGVVVTGGVAEQAGIQELAESILDLPVRIGQPQGVERLDDRLTSPAFATAIGLLVWAQQHGAEARVNGHNGGLHLPDIAGRAGRFFRAFLP
jgi:cell division protein FtsA